MTKLSAEKKRRFLDLYAELGTVTHAATAVGVTRQCIYKHRADDEAFAAAWQDSENRSTDSLEQEARRRALDSSDTLLIFMLKAKRPEQFRERIEHTGKDGGAILHQVSLLHQPDGD